MTDDIGDESRISRIMHGVFHQDGGDDESEDKIDVDMVIPRS